MLHVLHISTSLFFSLLRPPANTLDLDFLVIQGGDSSEKTSGELSALRVFFFCNVVLRRMVLFYYSLESRLCVYLLTFPVCCALRTIFVWVFKLLTIALSRNLPLYFVPSVCLNNTNITLSSLCLIGKRTLWNKKQAPFVYRSMKTTN